NFIIRNAVRLQFNPLSFVSDHNPTLTTIGYFSSILRFPCFDFDIVLRKRLLENKIRRHTVEHPCITVGMVEIVGIGGGEVFIPDHIGHIPSDQEGKLLLGKTVGLPVLAYLSV